MFGKLYLSFLVLVAIAIGVYVHNYISQNNEVAQKVQCLIQENEKADLKALKSFSVGIDEVFENYKKNVHNAVVNKPKWRALWETIKGNKGEAGELFNQHFNKEIFGKEDALLISLINDFEYKLEANRNNLCSNFNVYINDTKHSLNIEEVSTELKKQMEEIFSNTLSDSVNNLVVTTVSSFVAEELIRKATTTAITTFSAAGAAGGTATVGPVGTVVGVAVGFASGLAVDHFMEKSNNKKMEASIIQALDSAKEGTKRVLMDKLQKKIKNLNKGYLDEFKKNCM